MNEKLKSIVMRGLIMSEMFKVLKKLKTRNEEEKDTSSIEYARWLIATNFAEGTIDHLAQWNDDEISFCERHADMITRDFINVVDNIGFFGDTLRGVICELSCYNDEKWETVFHGLLVEHITISLFSNEVMKKLGYNATRFTVKQKHDIIGVTQKLVFCVYPDNKVIEDLIESGETIHDTDYDSIQDMGGMFLRYSDLETDTDTMLSFNQTFREVFPVMVQGKVKFKKVNPNG